MKPFFLFYSTILFFRFGLIKCLTDVQLGFLFTQRSDYFDSNVGFIQSAGVVPIALEKIRNLSLLPNLNLSFYWRFDNCIEAKASGESLELSKLVNVSVLFGPSCSQSVIRSSLVTQQFNTPIFPWGMVSASQIYNRNRFPNVFTVVSTFYSLSYAVIDLMKTFNWTTYTYLIASAEAKRCNAMHTDFATVIAQYYPKGQETYALITKNPPTEQNYVDFIKNSKALSRVIISCFDEDKWKRDFLLSMYDNGLNNSEWVHINMDLKKAGFQTNYNDGSDNSVPFYKDVYGVNDGRDNDALKMAKMMLNVDSSREVMLTQNVTNIVINNIKKWPFYCNDCNTTGISSISAYSSLLYDSLLVWAELMNHSITTYGEQETLANYSLLKSGCNRTFKGLLETFRYDADCIKLPLLQLRGLNKNGEPIAYINYTFTAVLAFNKLVANEDYESTIFANWDNQIPLNKPLCGYNGNSCPEDFFKDYLGVAVAIIVVIVLAVIFIVICTIYTIYRVRRNDIEELSKWKIPFIRLERPKDENIEVNQSLYSFSSGKTSKSSRATLNTRQDTTHFMYLYYDGQSVVGQKHNVKFFDTKENMKELTKILLMDHQNINKFFGMSIDGSIPLSIWGYCKRRSLFDILQTDNSMFDTFFLMCLIRDTVEGTHFIHNSFLNFHGQLTSKNCLISDRWQVKISNFNLKSLREREKLDVNDKLWMAPEHLRNDDSVSSQEGDIYSLGIIFSEIITKGSPWDLENRDESVQELIYLIKRGSFPLIRPEIEPYNGMEINPAMITLVKDCWNEKPDDRPSIKQIRSIVNAFKDKRSSNLMDHVFRILEEYAQTLRDEVNERTKELVEEQKKIDVLLNKMLPTSVASKLKLGKAIEPEDFDSVTIFFADVVKFTLLSSKCSPLQVITLVNDLYTMFDNIIESLDVYKVETIGDGYLCVSGLPIRNGNKHGWEIAMLSLRFMDSAHKFKIPFLPEEKVSLRIGCNTGPCVTSVVGLSMPRYCLFGDTVNTASRMESNGRPGRIHMTEACFNLLTELGGFALECRGEVIIKGKGVMTTYWLNGLAESNPDYIHYDITTHND
uniref:guanylate cyclase n=1 Tax=Parastrongyloides trichosuri TaxID=131310 RepID=A0A0N4ZZH4_PARTI